MRLHTSHLLGAIALAAFIFALMRHPEALIAALVPLVGGVCVVLPVLGVIEFFTPRDAVQPTVGWASAAAIALVVAAGGSAAIAIGLLLVQL